MLDDQSDRLQKISRIAATYNTLPPTERREAMLDYLFEVGDLLTELTSSEDITSPLHELIPSLADPKSRPLFQERRGIASPPGPELMARITVALDLLIEAGELPDYAAQIIARQMVRNGVELPTGGNDARGWKRLLFWRDRLRSVKQPQSGYDAYIDFQSEIASRQRDVVIEAALSGDLWNFRRQV
jgi:hypothetical protein